MERVEEGAMARSSCVPLPCGLAQRSGQNQAPLHSGLRRRKTQGPGVATQGHVRQGPETGRRGQGTMSVAALGWGVRSQTAGGRQKWEQRIEDESQW